MINKQVWTKKRNVCRRVSPENRCNNLYASVGRRFSTLIIIVVLHARARTHVTHVIYYVNVQTVDVYRIDTAGCWPRRSVPVRVG